MIKRGDFVTYACANCCNILSAVAIDDGDPPIGIACHCGDMRRPINRVAMHVTHELMRIPKAAYKHLSPEMVEKAKGGELIPHPIMSKVLM